MRAIGIVLVILNHILPEQTNHALFQVLQLPWMMMDSFFVMSGFLITGILLDTRHRPDYYRSFYGRRALRILPIYYVMLIAITLIAVLHSHAAYKDMLVRWGSPWCFFVYMGNIPTAITGLWPLAGGGSFVPLWSLQVEEQFYLLFPLLIHRLPLKSLKWVMLGLAGFSTVLRLFLYWRNPSNQLVQYVLLPCRLEGLAFGAWMAIRFREGEWNINLSRLRWTVVLGGLVSVGSAAFAGFDHTQPFNRTIGFLLSPLWFAAVILWLIKSRGGNNTAWLRTAPLQFLGRISYAAYLLHWPVANVLTTMGLQEGALRLLLIFVATFGISALSWYSFEKPLLNWKDRLFPSGRTLRAV